MQISFWEEESFYSGKDVIIIGAGLAGLWSAVELKKKNNALRILILEKGPVPQGASTRNAGFACFGSPTELLNDCQLLGEDKMLEIAEMRYRGLEKTKSFFGEDAIGLDKCGGYELLPASYSGLAALNENLAWLNKRFKQITGIENTFVRHDAKLDAFKFTGFASLVENQMEAGVHSGKLVQALTKKVLALGVEIITSAVVAGWQSTSAGVTVTTSEGYVFTAKQLLFCTNAYTSSLVNSLTVTPARGQIVLTAPIENLAFTGTFHYDEGYYYFRNVGNRVLLGGARNMAVEEEATTALETTALIQQELERFLKEHILHGQPFTIEKRWSGIMGFTPNKLPGVTKVAANTYAISSCNGMGVALAPVMAEVAAAMVLAQ